MEKKDCYVVLNLADEVMLIGQSEIPYDRDCSIVREWYLRNLGFNFSIGIFR